MTTMPRSAGAGTVRVTVRHAAWPTAELAGIDHERGARVEATHDGSLAWLGCLRSRSA